MSYSTLAFASIACSVDPAGGEGSTDEKSDSAACVTNNAWGTLQAADVVPSLDGLAEGYPATTYVLAYVYDVSPEDAIARLCAGDSLLDEERVDRGAWTVDQLRDPGDDSPQPLSLAGREGASVFLAALAAAEPGVGYAPLGASLHGVDVAAVDALLDFSPLLDL